MAISSPINVGNISKGVNSLKSGLGRVKTSAQGIKSILFKKTKVKQQAIAGKKILEKRRRENILRKDQEDLLEASGIKPTIRRTNNVIVDSTKGFLGRLLDFVGTLFVGWLLYNLHTIIAMTKDLIIRIQTLFGALTGFIGNIFNVFGDIGHILTGVLSDIVHLDFLDTDRKVRSSFDDLNTHFDNMGKQFEDGVNVFKTSLGEGKGEQKIPSTGTRAGGGANFGEPQNTTTGAPVSSGGGGGTRSQQAFTYFKSQGYSDEQAAAIIGNLTQENRALDPKVKNSIGHKGLAQWDPELRYPQMAAFARQRGLSPDSFEAQLAFVEEELKTGSGGLSKKKLQSTKSLEEATLLVRKQYERPGEAEANDANRLLFARQALRSGGSSAPQAQFGQPQYSTTGGALTKTKKGPYNRNFYGYAPSNGQVQYMTGDISQKDNYESSHGGGNYHDHLAFADHETALRAFDFFKSKGFFAWEMKDRTSLGPSHHKGGHAAGLAFDIPAEQNHWHVGKEYQGSAKVRAALAEFLGTPNSQISSPGSTTNVGALTPERRGPTVVVANNPQPQQPPSGGGGGGGEGGAMTSTSLSDALNSLIKQNLLLDLAYT